MLPENTALLESVLQSMVTPVRSRSQPCQERWAS